jgi:hypothetical protein
MKQKEGKETILWWRANSQKKQANHKNNFEEENSRELEKQSEMSQK